MITSQQTGAYCRPIPLHDRAEHQNCLRLAASAVPHLTDSARVTGRTARSVRYDDGCQRWYVHPSDKLRILAYELFRDPAEIEAGAFPLLAQFHDGSTLP